MNAYEKIGTDESILTKLYRFSVITKVFGIEPDEEIEIKKLSERAVDELRIDDYCDGMDSLAMLFGAGIINEAVFCRIVKGGLTNAEIITAAEKRVEEENEINDGDRLTPGIIQNALLLALITKKYPQIQSIDFDEAVGMSDQNHFVIADGLPKIKDKDFFRFLLDCGESFGVITNSGELYVETEDNLLHILEDEDTNISEEGFFPLGIRNLMAVSSVYDRLYGRDYIIYAKENGSEISAEGYEKYLKNVKLHFVINGYRRKRNICGSIVNWFDYAPSNDEGVTESQADYKREIDLDTEENYSEEKLIKKAVDKFRSVYTLEDNSVIEVFHNSGEFLYLVQGAELKELDKNTYHTMLFDFSGIWSVIQKYSRSRQIKKQGDSIVLPQEMWKEISPKDRTYAARLVKDQFIRFEEQRHNNKLFSSLSDLKNAAAEQRRKKEADEAEKNEKQRKYNEKKQSRGSSTEE